MGTRTYSRRSSSGQRILTAAGRVKFNQMTGLAEQSIDSGVVPQSVQTQLEALSFPAPRSGITILYENEYTPARIYREDKEEKAMVKRYKELIKKPIDRTTAQEASEIRELYHRLRVHLLGLETILRASRPAEELPDNAPEDIKELVRQENANRLLLTLKQRADVEARFRQVGQTAGGYSNG